jgi:hypothetical protein
MEINSLPLDIYFLPLDRKLTVDPNLTCLAPNNRKFELSPSLKRDLATPTATIFASKLIAISAHASVLTLHHRTSSDH